MEKDKNSDDRDESNVYQESYHEERICVPTGFIGGWIVFTMDHWVDQGEERCEDLKVDDELNEFERLGWRDFIIDGWDESN